MKKEIKIQEFEIHYHDTDDEKKHVRHCDSFMQMMQIAAEMVAFDDCSGQCVDFVTDGIRRYEYVGWQPDMLIEFYDTNNGEIVWSHYCPHWDH